MLIWLCFFWDPLATQAHAPDVSALIRLALLDDAFYANQDPQVFGRAVVGAVNDAVGYFLTHPGADAESLAESLCRIFAP